MYPKECKWIHVDKPQSITTYKDICLYNGYIIVSINKSITYQYYQWLLYVPRGVVLLTPRSETDDRRASHAYSETFPKFMICGLEQVLLT